MNPNLLTLANGAANALIALGGIAFTEVHQLVSIGAALAALVYTVLKIVQLYRDLK